MPAISSSSHNSSGVASLLVERSFFAFQTKNLLWQMV